MKNKAYLCYSGTIYERSILAAFVHYHIIAVQLIVTYLSMNLNTQNGLPPFTETQRKRYKCNDSQWEPTIPVLMAVEKATVYPQTLMIKVQLCRNLTANELESECGHLG